MTHDNKNGNVVEELDTREGLNRYTLQCSTVVSIYLMGSLKLSSMVEVLF